MLLLSAALVLQTLAFPSNWYSNEPTAKSTLIATTPLKPIDILQLNNGYLTEQDVNATSWASAKMTRNLPGIGSGLIIDPVTGTLISMTDRGANSDCPDGKAILMPRFAPSMVSTRLNNGNFEVFHSTMLQGKAGPIVGLANVGTDEKMYADPSCTAQITADRRGMDNEDVQAHPNGVHFFTSEEYSPSIAVFDASGNILKRYVPTTLAEQFAGFDDYPVSATLPGIFRQRRDNRGFESLALSKDGKTLWALLQSPMGDRKDNKFKDSRIIRALQLDASDPLNLQANGIFAFEASNPADYVHKDGKKGKASDLKFSSAEVVQGSTLVVLERVDDAGLRLLTVDFANATNLLGTPSETGLVVEDTTIQRQVQLAPTQIIHDIADLPAAQREPMTKKIEGLTLLSPATALLISDNDFGLDGLNTQFFTVSLTTKLPIANLEQRTCPYEFSDANGSYFKIPGPASRAVLSDACQIRGGRLIRVVKPGTTLQQGLAPYAYCVVNGMGICAVPRDARC
jgi:hypothetical protein